jgi:hypothetical protein
MIWFIISAVSLTLALIVWAYNKVTTPSDGSCRRCLHSEMDHLGDLDLNYCMECEDTCKFK